jgi:hypothetical protein
LALVQINREWRQLLLLDADGIYTLMTGRN